MYRLVGVVSLQIFISLGLPSPNHSQKSIKMLRAHPSVGSCRPLGELAASQGQIIDNTRKPDIKQRNDCIHFPNISLETVSNLPCSWSRSSSTAAVSWPWASEFLESISKSNDGGAIGYDKQAATEATLQQEPYRLSSPQA